MKRLMLDHAFASVPTVLFTVHEDNIRSQAAVERLGAVRIGTAPDPQGRGQNLLFHLRRAQAAALDSGTAKR
jgi:N-acetyltransferase